MTSFGSKTITLYDHQEDAVQRLRDAFRAGASKLVLVAPTAFGKTECAGHIIQQSQVKRARTWFIVDRVTLINQTSDRFFQYGIDHGVIQADNVLTDKTKPVQIASAQTLARRSFPANELPDLIVVDECHCQYKSVLDLMAKSPKARIIGLTATPFTEGMADHWQGLINGSTVNQLLATGFLTPLKIKACVTPDMKGVKRQRDGEYDQEDVGARGVKIIGNVLETWISETNKHFGGPAKTIVFSPSVKWAQEFCEQAATAGYNFQLISYLDASDDERREKIAEFKKPDSAIDGLVSCAVLTKGFDVPDVKVGISCRPYRKSFSSHIQELGRVMRIAEGKDFGLWLDHSGNCIAFAEDTAWLYEYGVTSLSDVARKDKEVREPKEKVKHDRFCPECGSMLQPSAMACEDCGWSRPARGEVEIVQGELIDFEAKLGSADVFTPRSGLRAACLRDPRAIWNAALSFCLANGARGDMAARKWAYGIWRGIYPNSTLPYGLYEMPNAPDRVREDEWGLVEREVRRFRKSASRRAA